MKKVTLILPLLVLATAPACWRKKHTPCHEECSTEYIVEERMSGPAGWGSEEQIEEMEETIKFEEFEETLK